MGAGKGGGDVGKSNARQFSGPSIEDNLRMPGIICCHEAIAVTLASAKLSPPLHPAPIKGGGRKVPRAR